MSKCFICDCNIDQPKIDPIDLKVRPCFKCEQVIQETVEGFRDPGEDMFAYIEEDHANEDKRWALNAIDNTGFKIDTVGDKYEEMNRYGPTTKG